LIRIPIVKRVGIALNKFPQRNIVVNKICFSINCFCQSVLAVPNFDTSAGRFSAIIARKAAASNTSVVLTSSPLPY
jgi:hypothetical protein